MATGDDEAPPDAPQPPYEILERGEIYFFYRPKVSVEEPHSRDDVQHMYLVLRPEFAAGEGGAVEEKQSSDSGIVSSSTKSRRNGAVGEGKHGGDGAENIEIGKKPLFRYIVMGRKSLPETTKRTRPYWGFVELVTTNPDDLKKMLAAEEYETKTRGHRVNPAARPVGEGVYTLVHHHSGTRTDTRLVYKLEYPGPHKKHEPQDALNIEDQASYIIQIKNPEQPAPPSTGLGRKRRALFPAHLQAKFGSRRFVPADPPDFLNYEGAEFILIPASSAAIEPELGVEIETSDSVNKNDDDLIEILGLSKDSKRIRPLINGVWA
ncbi:unnamed protein product [Sphagnum jensenii]|uniref:Uncharacterized protein n=1 Tax=Sphagnum jensenii TaxID=128206 RepID=A0ABP0X9Z5_9BRYO